MAQNTIIDSIEFDRLELPYNRIIADLSDEPRWVQGVNTFTTLGGKLRKRPCFDRVTNGSLNGRRADRWWSFETIEYPNKVWDVISAFNSTSNVWELWYKEPGGAWTLAPELRQSNHSSRPHEAAVARGLLYIKGFPDDTLGEKLGSVIFDATTTPVSVKPWGILGPTEPARIAGGAVTALSGDLNSTSTSLTVTTDAATAGFPSPNFLVTIGYEQLLVTNIGSGTNWTATRAQGGTVGAPHPDGSVVLWRNWAASSHQVTVENFWRYSYCYKSITGQLSDRAPDETNPDLLPSSTGPFRNLVPQITYEGHPDTVNIPTIVILRTSDGGGTFYILDEIPNPGAGTHTYLDNQLASGPTGAVHNDPIPDSQLDTFTIAPTRTSNSPPPSTVAPNVIGTDPILPSSPIAYYAGRFWYFIGNVLFFSAQEELFSGVPEESFPSGLRGNFYRFQYEGTNLIETSQSLIICTTQCIYEITGTTKETFNVRPVYSNLGFPQNQHRAIVRFGDTIVTLSHDYRVMMLGASPQPLPISDPLGNDILIHAQNGAQFDFKYFADQEKEWLMVFAYNLTPGPEAICWTFDIKKSLPQTPFWNTPWTLFASAAKSARYTNSNTRTRVEIFSQDPAGTSTGGSLFLNTDSSTLGQDRYWTASGDGYQGVDFQVASNLFMVPIGNHINQLRRPEANFTLHSIWLERTKFANDTNPNLWYFTDDLWTDPRTPQSVNEPPRRYPSKGYVSLEHQIRQIGKRFGFRVGQVVNTQPIELQSFAMTFDTQGSV